VAPTTGCSVRQALLVASRSLPARRVPYPYPLFAACVRKVSSSPQPYLCYTGIVAQAKMSRFHFIGSSPTASTFGHLFLSSPWRMCVPGVASTVSRGPSLIGRYAGPIVGPLPPVAHMIGQLGKPLIFTMDKRCKANSPGDYWMLVACKLRARWAKARFACPNEHGRTSVSMSLRPKPRVELPNMRPSLSSLNHVE
jgi:hypothetical protein